MHEIQMKETIIKLRKERGLTQKQLADQINFSDKVISKWECGESYPDIVALKKLSDFFNVTIDELVNPSSQKENPSNLESSKLDVTTTEQPSLVAKIWILIPFAALIVSFFYGVLIFAISLFGFGLILILYGFTIANYTFEAIYRGKTIKIINRVKKIELYIDNELVDGIYSILAFNPELIGKIENKTVRVKITNLTSFKCNIFVS